MSCAHLKTQVPVLPHVADSQVLVLESAHNLNHFGGSPYHALKSDAEHSLNIKLSEYSDNIALYSVLIVLSASFNDSLTLKNGMNSVNQR